VNVPIPEDDISGPVLALAGGDDALVTDAGQSANEIAFDLASEGGDRYRGHAFVYPDAGHAVGTFPYQPITAAASTPSAAPGRGTWPRSRPAGRRSSAYSPSSPGSAG
jgi:hypothetical protein